LEGFLVLDLSHSAAVGQDIYSNLAAALVLVRDFDRTAFQRLRHSIRYILLLPNAGLSTTLPELSACGLNYALVRKWREEALALFLVYEAEVIRFLRSHSDDGRGSDNAACAAAARLRVEEFGRRLGNESDLLDWFQEHVCTANAEYLGQYRRRLMESTGVFDWVRAWLGR
jgi:hypothetical protein